MTEAYLTRRQASSYIESKGLACKPETLARYAHTGEGPKMLYFNKEPRYTTVLLDEWVEERVRGPFRRASEVRPSKSP